MYISSGEKAKCHAIIHGASAAAATTAAGLAQIPFSDNAIITPIQVTMIVSLGAVLDIKLSKSAATAILGTVATSTLGRCVSQVLLGWIPGVGNALNATTAATITEAAGWAAFKYFENLSDVEARKHKEAKEEGRQEAKCEYEVKIKELKEKFKKVCEIIKEYEKLEAFYMAAFSIGIAVANIDDNISTEEREMLESLTVGLGYNTLPEIIKSNISRLFYEKPTFNDAMKLIEMVDREHWSIIDDIIDVILQLDERDNEKKSALKTAWNQKYQVA